MNVNAQFATSSGRRLQLGKVLGKGGEGTIFDIGGDDTIAAKIYTDGKALERRPKLKAMIADRLDTKTSFVAFPIETVTANGNFVGFTMRKAVGAKTVHQLCLPSDRKEEFPNATFRFLVRAALNYARAVASIYKLGAVIGDVNESGALVDQKGLITVIDSDSFQYRSAGQVFRCGVGKPEYTPPELQGKLLGKVERTVDHDAFGIAVIIFELLFMGRHPFSGVYNGPGDQPTIARAIQDGRFAYSPFKSATMMEPPPYVPVLADIPLNVAAAFQRAFRPCMGRQAEPRPTAAEWIPLLESMEKNLVECQENPVHYYAKNAPGCPWCRFEAGLNAILFVPYRSTSPRTFDLAHVVSKIDGIANPGPAPDLASLMPAVGSLKPTQAVRRYKTSLVARKGAGLAATGLALFLMSNRMGWGFFVLIPAGLLFFGKSSGAIGIHQQISRARDAWNSSIETWNRSVGNAPFNDKKSDLIKAATSYRALPSVEREMFAALDNKKRDLQIQKYLEAHKIDRARIDGIGDGRKLTLRSFNIETAWDIKTHAVRAVPGFGEVLTKKLLAWRRTVEGKFRFDPHIPTDPTDIAKVRAEIARLRTTIETTLLKGPGELETIRTEVLVKRRDMSAYRKPYIDFMQAEVDAAFL